MAISGMTAFYAKELTPFLKAVIKIGIKDNMKKYKYCFTAPCGARIYNLRIVGDYIRFSRNIYGPRDIQYWPMSRGKIKISTVERFIKEGKTSSLGLSIMSRCRVKRIYSELLAGKYKV